MFTLIDNDLDMRVRKVTLLFIIVVEIVYNFCPFTISIQNCGIFDEMDFELF